MTCGISIDFGLLVSELNWIAGLPVGINQRPGVGRTHVTSVKAGCRLTLGCARAAAAPVPGGCAWRLPSNSVGPAGIRTEESLRLPPEPFECADAFRAKRQNRVRPPGGISQTLFIRLLRTDSNRDRIPECVSEAQKGSRQHKLSAVSCGR